MFKAQAISPVIPYENLSTAYNLALEYRTIAKDWHNESDQSRDRPRQRTHPPAPALARRLV